jgi:hypothetical protein
MPKVFRYRVISDKGSADGTIHADSKDDANHKLTEQYGQKYMDESGQEKVVHLVKIALKEVV